MNPPTVSRRLRRVITAGMLAMVLTVGSSAVAFAEEPTGDAVATDEAREPDALETTQDPVVDNPETEAPMEGSTSVSGTQAPNLAFTPTVSDDVETPAATTPQTTPSNSTNQVEAAADSFPDQLPVATRAAGTPGVSVDNGDGTSTLTWFNDETLTYPNEVVLGEPIPLSGTGWLTKADHQGTGDYEVVEGDEGSITGIKFFTPDGGTVVRDPKPTNPWNGDTDYASPDVWEIVQAAGTGGHWDGAEPGSWSVEVPWPSAHNDAVDPPSLAVGDTFTLQLLSGTLYGNTVGNQNLRPDVSRTISQSFTIVESITDPEVPEYTEPTFTTHPQDLTLEAGETGQVTVRVEGPIDSSIVGLKLTRWDETAQTWVDLAPTVEEVQELPFDHTFITEAVQIDWDGSRIVGQYELADGTFTHSHEAILTVTPAVIPEPEFLVHPRNVTVVEGEAAKFSVELSARPDDASVSFVLQAQGERGWTPLLAATVDARTESDTFLHTFILPGVQLADSGNSYRVLAHGTIVSQVAVLTVTPDESTEPGDESAPVITLNPLSQTIEAGEPVTFRAAAIGSPTPTVQWQRSKNGGQTWFDLRGATSNSYTIDVVIAPDDGEEQWQYRAVFTNREGTTESSTATLDVTPRSNMRVACGFSYGPGSVNTGIEFCYTYPEKVVFGEPIVIEGVSGYLATDNATGSVVNFFLDHEYSGDPNGVYSKALHVNPGTGQVISDRRTVNVVQADRNTGVWRAEIPFPTVDNVSPDSDGITFFDEQELTEKFGPGTTHGIRMLSGSLLNSPVDRQRGFSAYFTVVESLDDELGVTRPVYSHQEFVSEVDGDSAVAWVPANIENNSDIALSGTGWLTKDQQWGSTVVVRLQNETGGYYRREGTVGDPHIDPTDPTIWQVVQASELGEINVRVRAPGGLTGGDFVAVELTTSDDGTALGDVERHWVSEPLTINGSPFIPELGDDATCTAGTAEASYELAPGMAVPAANIGGTIRIVGENWCNLVGGGSLLAFKINAGSFQHLPTMTAAHFDANVNEETGQVIGETGASPASISQTNKTIWYVIEADKYGNFDVEIPLPNRANSIPAFTEGSYTFTILTRTISADPYYAGTRPDPSRSVQTEEFTVVAEGTPLDNVRPGRPTAPPDPLHVSEQLTNANRGGVSVTQQADQWVVTIPRAATGDWVYVNVYDGPSPRFPWGTQWFEVNSRGQVILPLAGAALPVGTNTLSVQDRHGEPLGWTSVYVAAPPSSGGSNTGVNQTIVSSSGSSNQGSFRYGGRPQMSGAGSAQTTNPTRPDFIPEQPVPGISELTHDNARGVTALEEDGRLTITIPQVDGGEWVFLFLYTADGRVVEVDWVQVGTDHTIVVEIAGLPVGNHKLAVVNADGDLVGWVNASGENAGVAESAEQAQAPRGLDGSELGSPVTNSVADMVPAGSDHTLTLILIALGILFLSGAGTIALRMNGKSAR